MLFLTLYLTERFV